MDYINTSLKELDNVLVSKTLFNDLFDLFERGDDKYARAIVECLYYYTNGESIIVENEKLNQILVRHTGVIDVNSYNYLKKKYNW